MSRTEWVHLVKLICNHPYVVQIHIVQTMTLGVWKKTTFEKDLKFNKEFTGISFIKNYQTLAPLWIKARKQNRSKLVHCKWRIYTSLFKWHAPLFFLSKVSQVSIVTLQDLFCFLHFSYLSILINLKKTHWYQTYMILIKWYI